MAVKYNRTDDLDKMFEEFATLPKLEKVEFPDNKKKKETEEKAKYFGQQFIELWAEYLKFNFTVGNRLK